MTESSHTTNADARSNEESLSASLLRQKRSTLPKLKFSRVGFFLKGLEMSIDDFVGGGCDAISEGWDGISDGWNFD